MDHIFQSYHKYLHEAFMLSTEVGWLPWDAWSDLWQRLWILCLDQRDCNENGYKLEFPIYFIDMKKIEQCKGNIFFSDCVGNQENKIRMWKVERNVKWSKIHEMQGRVSILQREYGYRYRYRCWYCYWFYRHRETELRKRENDVICMEECDWIKSKRNPRRITKYLWSTWEDIPLWTFTTVNNLITYSPFLYV